MYKKEVEFKDFNNNPRKMTVTFNLTETEVFKLLNEFKTVFEWRNSLDGAQRDLGTAEVVEFYNAFENILLASYGVPSEDGLHFRKAGRYEFEESAVFNACMISFVTDPTETSKLIEGIMPKGMEEMIAKADANLVEAAANSNDAELKAEIARLRTQIAEGNPATVPAG